LASDADAANNRLDTGKLVTETLHNTADYTAHSEGIAGGTRGQVSGGLTSIPQHDSSHSDTRAGIAEGTVVVRDGKADLSDVDRHPDIDAKGLKPIFNADKVAEKQELGAVAGDVGFRAAGTVANRMADAAAARGDKANAQAWSEGGSKKILLHGLVGAGMAVLGGGNGALGATGAGASQAASGAMVNYLRAHGIDPNSPDGKLYMQLASQAIGGAAGGSAGAAAAQAGELNNRQLHTREIDWIKSHALEYAQAHGLSEAQATI
ncbi:MAG: hypothetical protein RMZ43_035920, partial [Nostoc sp. CmiVER01]|uniref:hypothetical protein n=1 Tax=Nostoc sp. CmiVER01 TaxID=3075384 RepID=UPI003D1618E4